MKCHYGTKLGNLHTAWLIASKLLMKLLLNGGLKTWNGLLFPPRGRNPCWIIGKSLLLLIWICLSGQKCNCIKPRCHDVNSGCIKAGGDLAYWYYYGITRSNLHAVRFTANVVHSTFCSIIPITTTTLLASANISRLIKKLLESTDYVGQTLSQFKRSDAAKISSPSGFWIF